MLLSGNSIANSFCSDVKKFCTCTVYTISNWKFDFKLTESLEMNTLEQSLFPRQQSALFLRTQKVFK